MMLVAAPFLLSAGIGLLFRRAWQRVVFAGAASAAIYAAMAYSLQAGMVRRGPAPAGTVFAEPVGMATEVALVTLPIGMCAGLLLHLITRLIRTIKA